MRFDIVGGSDRVLKEGVRNTLRRDPEEEVLYQCMVSRSRYSGH